MYACKARAECVRALFFWGFPMLWLKILHIVIITSNAFLFGILFSKFSAGKWRTVDAITFIGTLVSFVIFTLIIIFQDF
jgi:hypothetical protein